PCPSPFLLRTLQVSPTLVSGEIGAIHVTLDRTGAPTRNHARSVWRSGDGSPVRLLLEGRIGDSRPAVNRTVWQPDSRQSYNVLKSISGPQRRPVCGVARRYQFRDRFKHRLRIL